MISEILTVIFIALCIIPIVQSIYSYFKYRQQPSQETSFEITKPIEQTKIPNQPKKIECVIVCNEYSDFLCWTLPLLKPHFDNTVVVTSSKDLKTKKLCDFYHVKCIITDVCFDKDGKGFNKGKMINAGFDAIDKDGWICHLDADIVLPSQFRYILNSIVLDEKSIYGIDRLMCQSFEDWLKFYMEPPLQHEANAYIHPRPFNLGVRIGIREYQYYCVIGFFQLFHSSMNIRYPEEHSNAGRSDLMFCVDNFPREKRHLLPEIIGIHLETKIDKNSLMGDNWNGRKTPPFGYNTLKNYYVLDDTHNQVNYNDKDNSSDSIS